MVDAAVKEFLDNVEHPRKQEDSRTLVKLMRETTGEEPVIKQEGRLSLSLDSGSIALVWEHFLFRELYHRTGRSSLNVTNRHSALCVVLIARPTFECVYGSARHIKPRRLS